MARETLATTEGSPNLFRPSLGSPGLPLTLVGREKTLATTEGVPVTHRSVRQAPVKPSTPPPPHHPLGWVRGGGGVGGWHGKHWLLLRVPGEVDQ